MSMVSEERKWGDGTTALHTGYSPVPLDMTLFRSFVPPIIESSVYPFESVAHGARVLQHKEPGYYYGRMNNPTVDVLQKRLAALEGGESALATASGMHGVFALTNHLAKVGDEIVTSHMIYGEAYKLFFQLAPERLGITPRFVNDPADLDDWERQITPKTRFVWAETPSNPTTFITDIAGLAEITHAHNVPLIVDNTLATPSLLRPLELGADIVLLSLTKFVGGQGSIVGGAVIGSEDLIEDMAARTLGYIGSTMSPIDAWLTLMSVETLPLRMSKHSRNAETVAAYLAQHPKVREVNYPGLPEHPQYELARRQMPDGCGGMMSFEVEGGLEGAATVMESCQMIPIVVTFGTSRTVATHPASHTHWPMSREEREAAGIYDGLIRLSIGLEDAEDIIADLEQALDRL
jgi:O-acetylhomoserine/O-acetylserine sulfhydrylase-like pyridoxal-dependent enzyme